MTAVIDSALLTDSDVAQLRSLRAATSNGSTIAAILDGLIDGSSMILEKDLAITPAQAASILGVSRPYVTRMLKTGILKSHMVGSHHRIDINDLQDYMERRDAGRREYARALNSRNADLNAQVDATAPVSPQSSERMLAMVRNQRERSEQNKAD